MPPTACNRPRPPPPWGGRRQRRPRRARRGGGGDGGAIGLRGPKGARTYRRLFTRLNTFAISGRNSPSDGDARATAGLHSPDLGRSARRCERPDTRPVLLDVRVGVVARAHERAGGDVLETQLVGRSFEGGELVGVPVADDRE